jgi:hypothetical protein
MENLINNTFLSYFLLIIIILIFISNCYNFNKTNEKFSNSSTASSASAYPIESIGQGSIICAKSCCHSGWPNSIELDETAYGVKPGDMGTKFRSTSYTCNNGFTGGCVCDKI